MLKKLRLRLALLCALMTGTVFAAFMITVTIFTENQLQRMNELLFQNNITAIVNRLQSEPLVNTDWLAETEAAQSCIISIGNNGQPLRFGGAGFLATNRGEIIQSAREQALMQADFDYRIPPLDITQPVQTIFQMDGNLQSQYRCAIVKIPTQENWLSLTIVADRTAEIVHISSQRNRYLMLSFLVLIILCAVIWWFTGKAIRPTAENIERQREFIAAASHELRSPLMLIEATASAIRVAPYKTGELTRGIEAECGRLGRLVGDLLLLANTDTVSWLLHLAPIELDTVLIETVEKFEEPARQSGFSLVLELPERILPRMNGDTERLGQIVSILLDNAISHAGGGGTITVRAAQNHQGISISVIDHGKGIPLADRQRVFDRFYQVDTSRTDKNHFGLGLSVVKELVRLHKGSIELSETAGGGCTFQICFPVLSSNRV